MAQIKGKQIQQDSIDLSKLKAGSKILPDSATFGTDKTIEQITNPKEFSTKEYVDAQIGTATEALFGTNGIDVNSTSGISFIGGNIVLNQETKFLSETSDIIFDATADGTNGVKYTLNNGFGGYARTESFAAGNTTQLNVAIGVNSTVNNDNYSSSQAVSASQITQSVSWINESVPSILYDEGKVVVNTSSVNITATDGNNTYDQGELVVGKTNIQLNMNDGFSGDVTSVEIEKGAITVGYSGTDFSFGGIKYDTDYSLNYSDRSLVDKAYVDSQLTSNSSAWEIALAAEASTRGDVDAANLILANSYTDTQITNLIDGASTGGNTLKKLEDKISFIINNNDPASLDSLSEIVTAFQGADGSLGGAITQLATDLQNNLDAEASTRGQVDTYLQQQIDLLNSGVDSLSASNGVQRQGSDFSILLEGGNTVAGLKTGTNGLSLDVTNYNSTDAISLVTTSDDGITIKATSENFPLITLESDWVKINGSSSGIELNSFGGGIYVTDEDGGVFLESNNGGVYLNTTDTAIEVNTTNVELSVKSDIDYNIIDINQTDLKIYSHKSVSDGSVAGEYERETSIQVSDDVIMVRSHSVILDSEQNATNSHSTAFKGMTYDADYSSQYVERSLVDKAYVDSKVSQGALSDIVELDITGFVAAGTSGVVEYTGSVTFIAGVKTDADVFVNGIKIDSPEMVFFGSAGNARPQVGQSIFFDLSVLGYEIESDDLIEIKYHI